MKEKYIKRVEDIALDSKVQIYFDQRDREGLYSYLRDKFDLLKKNDANFKILNFHLPDGTVFLRMQKPEVFGDNLNMTRPMVKVANMYTKHIDGYEVGESGLAYRVFLPFFNQKDEFRGSLEIGVNPSFLSEDITSIEGFKSVVVVPKALCNESSSFEIGDYFVCSKVDAEMESILNYVLDKNVFLKKRHQFSFQKKDYVVHHQELKNFNNEFFAIVLFLQDVTSISKVKTDFILQYGSILLFAIFTLAYFTNREMKILEVDIRAINQRHHQELENVKNNYKELYELAPNPYQSLDKDGRFLEVNNAWLNELGYEKEEVLGKSFADFLPPHHKEKFFESFPVFVEQGTVNNIGYDIVKKDGSIVKCVFSALVIRDESGNFKRTQCIFANMTKEINMRKHLEIEKKFIENIFDFNANMILVLVNYNIDTANRSLLDFFGKESVEDFKEKHSCIATLFQPEEGCLRPKIEDALWVDYVLEHPHDTHKAVFLQNDKKYIFKVNAKKMELDKENRVVVSFTDITQIKEAQDAIKEKDQAMIAQSRHAAMGEMISMIAHQWKQPVAVISMDANNMLADIELESVNLEGFQKMTKDVLVQTQHLAQTIDDFRDFFRPDKKEELVLTKDVVENSLRIIGKSLENNGIQINKIYESNNKISTLPRELIQVFINIIKNAKEAIVERSVKKGVVTIRTYEDDAYQHISISDNAGGIKEKNMPHIFDSYFSTKGEKEGTGLGLYMSKIIIEKNLGGVLMAQNKNGGAEFLISLPIKKQLGEMVL
ncbi:MAG: PAS domain S-box protein [Sulfurospirillaceae bacterium]|nr:PAS domain S-box protein [Sulfurospirillaceae bacterium]